MKCLPVRHRCYLWMPFTSHGCESVDTFEPLEVETSFNTATNTTGAMTDVVIALSPQQRRMQRGEKPE